MRADLWSEQLAAHRSDRVRTAEVCGSDYLGPAVTSAFTVLGTVAAALILLGVAAPWRVPGAQQANFAGCVLWSG
ncbi:hypothetical protein ACFV4K_35490 [Nocardia sp. NPDC059764]|uniref:hypothetical protein n=1 Tax=Nocardia sp. NPDC059764 TaxID=3346939 RepID=UPI00364C8A86